MSGVADITLAQLQGYSLWLHQLWVTECSRTMCWQGCVYSNMSTCMCMVWGEYTPWSHILWPYKLGAHTRCVCRELGNNFCILCWEPYKRNSKQLWNSWKAAPSQHKHKMGVSQRGRTLKTTRTMCSADLILLWSITLLIALLHVTMSLVICEWYKNSKGVSSPLLGSALIP